MDKELLDAGYRAYTGEKIDVYFNTDICQHSGNCVRGSAKLFNLKRKPWIVPDEVDVATVVKRRTEVSPKISEETMEILEGHNKFYVNDADGNQVAEIVFVPTGEHLSIIEHTDVDPSLKGQGVGKKLVAKVVEKMRGEQRKIIPLCPFAKHEFDNTREYDDIRA
ncbi:hypothetical protein RF11_03167 [Thelohanellus kitauei]|uniref:Protein NATD1 n=6 Tax=cellular organisms TaxID=131567 RepID=A0A0C2M7T7_THEKT|nr:hypothetical protein RF11_03167 [Thelohanellus kitauei]